MYQINNKQTNAKRHESMPYPRFTKVIIQYFISKNKSISMRNRLLMHSIKNDSVLGRLKFVSKNEDNQVYGMSIPDVMINKEIENSKAYQTYLAFLIGTIIPYKSRKGTKAAISPKKKGSFSIDDNIILDPEVALKLGKSIKKPTSVEESDESDSEPANRSTRKRRQADKLTQEKQLKPAYMSTNPSFRLMAQVKELDTYDVKDIDEEDYGSKEDDVILTSDEERTESNKETTESGKTNEDSDDEEEHNDDETQEEEHVHDDEYVPDDSKKHEDADEEMKEAKIAKEGKTNEVMDDVAQANVKKTNEEKVEIEQARNVQAIEKA
ncbi:hypothetical protein Tco_1137433 [Tanacetum coccineum]